MEKMKYLYELRLEDERVLNFESDGIWNNNDKEDPNNRTLIISAILTKSYMQEVKDESIEVIAEE